MADSPSDRRFVFVVGAPRTGTTLVREILNRHPEVHLFDEIHFFERIWDDRARLGDLSSPPQRREAVERVRRILRDFGTDPIVPETIDDAELEARMIRAGGGHRGLLAAVYEAGASIHGASVGGDSSPQDVLYLPTIFEWFPSARVVALVRDPRGFLSSYKNYHRRGVSSYRESYNPITNALLWRGSMSALLDAESQPWADRVMRLRYEDLVADPEREARRLCAHAGIEFRGDLLDVERANSSFVPESETTKRRGIFSSSTDRWKQELTPTELWIAQRLTGRWMAAFGYAPLEGALAPRPSPVELARIAAVLPGRLYNLLFHSHKPLRFEKVRRVFSLLRSG